MPLDFFNNVTATALAEYVNLQTPTTFLGETIFPQAKRANISLEWIVKNKVTPTKLEPSNFDAKPTLRVRQAVTDVKTKLPFFREAMRLTEQQQQDLIDFAASNNNTRTLDTLREIYDDVYTLVQGANVIPEAMRMSILQDAKFSFASTQENGKLVAYNYDYDPNGTWAQNNKTTLTGNDLWTNTTSNPIKDLLNIKQKAASKGVDITKVIMNSTTFGYMLTNQAILNMIANPNSSLNFVSEQDLITFVKLKVGIEIIVYNKTYLDSPDDKNPTKYVKDNVVICIPEDKLGYTWYGRTPEELSMQTVQVQYADIAIVNTGVAILTQQKQLPATVITSVSQLVLPSFEGINSDYVLLVA